jgi:hypothetical protein
MQRINVMGLYKAASVGGLFHSNTPVSAVRRRMPPLAGVATVSVVGLASATSNALLLLSKVSYYSIAQNGQWRAFENRTQRGSVKPVFDHSENKPAASSRRECNRDHVQSGSPAR